MDETIDSTFKLPLMMAKYGQVKMKRIDIMKIVGQLFRLKMNVNLISNVLDTPEIFDSEPELKGLYNAIRGKGLRYLCKRIHGNLSTRTSSQYTRRCCLRSFGNAVGSSQFKRNALHHLDHHFS